MTAKTRDDTPGSGEAVAGPAESVVTAPEPSPVPMQVGKGETLVRTRHGYAFQGSTIDVPITSVGVYVNKTQAEEIIAEAEAHGEVVFIDETPEG